MGFFFVIFKFEGRIAFKKATPPSFFYALILFVLFILLGY
jgi:hypothetical protein